MLSLFSATLSRPSARSVQEDVTVPLLASTANAVQRGNIATWLRRTRKVNVRTAQPGDIREEKETVDSKTASSALKVASARRLEPLAMKTVSNVTPERSHAREAQSTVQYAQAAHFRSSTRRQIALAALREGTVARGQQCASFALRASIPMHKKAR